jgi:hypothetical protein
LGVSPKNPSDYLDSRGLEVKKSLSDGIEHHHLQNNVYLDESGRITPAYVRFHAKKKTGDMEMEDLSFDKGHQESQDYGNPGSVPLP